LGVGGARGRDRLSNSGGGLGGATASVGGTLHTTMASASVSQVLTTTLVADLGYDFVFLRGFQENPYRLVPAGGQLEVERVPERRQRHAVAATVRAYVPRTGTTLVPSYRLYADDWGILAHTPELRVLQDLHDGLDLAVRYRYHTQDAADFYRPVY